MGKTSLVENDIIDGRYLIDALQESGFRVPVAFWWLLNQSGEWRLIIASPLAVNGPIEAYTAIQPVLKRLTLESALAPPLEFVRPFSLALSDISVLGPNEDLVRHIRRIFLRMVGTSNVGKPIPLPPRNSVMKAISQGLSVPGIRLTQIITDGLYIDDAFIYSLKNSPKLVERAQEGIREVVLEHKVNDSLTVRNVAKIDRDDRILELRARKGPWKVGDKVSPESYRER